MSSSEVGLAWTAPSDLPAARYNVYQGTSSGGESTNPVNSAPITGTTFSVTGLSGGTTYYFLVTAVDAAGKESSVSSEASDTTAPSASEPASGVTPSP